MQSRRMGQGVSSDRMLNRGRQSALRASSLSWALSGACLSNPKSPFWSHEGQILRKESRAGKDIMIPQLSPISMFLKRQHRRAQTINLRNVRGRANIPVLSPDKTWKDTEPFQRFPWVYKALLRMIVQVSLHCIEAQKPLSCLQGNRGVIQPRPQG